MLRILAPLGVFGLLLAFADGLAAEEPRELTLLKVEEFQKKFDSQVARGYRPIDFAVYSEQKTTRMAVIWAKRPGLEFKVLVDLPVDDLEMKTDEFRGMGFRLVRLSAHRAGTVFNYSGIWEKTETPMHARVGFVAANFETDRRKLLKEGSCPVHLTVNVVNGQDFYSCLWDVKGEPERELERGLLRTEVDKAIPKRLKDGFRVLQVCGYLSGKSDRYCCIWEKSEGSEQDVTMRQTGIGLTRGLKRMQAKGLQPTRISAYPMGKSTRFAVVWDKEK